MFSVVPVVRGVREGDGRRRDLRGRAVRAVYGGDGLAKHGPVVVAVVIVVVMCR